MPVAVVNLEHAELDEHGELALKQPLGAEAVGATVYELAPGSRICPYHWHAAEEEWLLVLAGRPTLRTAEGERVLREGDVFAFPCGPDGAHEVRNESDERVRVVMISNLADVEICVYPDSGKVRTQDDERVLGPHDVVCFPEGERGTHQVLNRTDEHVRVLFLSTKASVAFAVYPDEADELYLFAPGRVEGRVRRVT